VRYARMADLCARYCRGRRSDDIMTALASSLEHHDTDPLRVWGKFNTPAPVKSTTRKIKLSVLKRLGVHDTLF